MATKQRPSDQTSQNPSGTLTLTLGGIPTVPLLVAHQHVHALKLIQALVLTALSEILYRRW